jgi:hypothetical protein
MSTNPFPAMPAQPWAVPPLPGAPGVETLARALSPEENQARARVVYGRALMQGAAPMLGIGGVVCVVLMAMLAAATGLSPWIVALVTAIVWVLVCALGIGIGVPLGLALSRRRAEAELGPGRVLTVAWNEFGFSVAGFRGVRSVPLSDVRAVRRGGVNDWFVVVRTRMRFVSTEPYILALPADLVPQRALDALFRTEAKR